MMVLTNLGQFWTFLRGTVGGVFKIAWHHLWTTLRLSLNRRKMILWRLRRIEAPCEWQIIWERIGMPSLCRLSLTQLNCHFHRHIIISRWPRESSNGFIDTNFLFYTGGHPYPAVNNYNLLPFLSAGNRLEKPENCSDYLYELMTDCWAARTVDRPDFSTILAKLDLHERTYYVDFSELSSDYVFPPTKEQIKNNQLSNGLRPFKEI